MKELINKLEATGMLDKNEFVFLLSNFTPELSAYLFEKARNVSKKYFGNGIYTRGLIEFTNYCRNNCYYCGIRAGNLKADRYRLTRGEILECCRDGYELGFRTFVLQGGEDSFFSDKDIVGIITSIKEQYPDCAITLSIGEKREASYREFFNAGADRYLLRHETANEEHYSMLHPNSLSLSSRKECLYTLKKIGYQVGAGFMVGSPHQTFEHIAEDFLFIKSLAPEMIGVGPFLPHHDTPFKDRAKGSYDLTLFIIGLMRLMMPNALIPATTALGTINPKGRETGILAGANVVMPNLSPVRVRKKYELYDDKICTDEEAAECSFCLNNRMKSIGYELVVDRGDFKPLV